MQAWQAQALVRMKELFKPIDQQIQMTDNRNDLALLARVMTTTSKKLFTDQFGEEVAKDLMKTLIEE